MKRRILTPMETKIVTEAVKLAAKDGFDAVTMEMIAEAVGIKAPSLYKHFKNKRDIFDAILNEMEWRDAKNARESGLPLEPLDDGIYKNEYEYNSTEKEARNSANMTIDDYEDESVPLADEYADVDMQAFLDYCRKMFRYWTGDEFASSFRKMLTIEQYKDQEMHNLYHQYLGTGPLGYTADIVGSEKAALALYGPMFMLYSIFDEAKSKYVPGFEDSIYGMLDTHLDSWYAEYSSHKA